MRGIGIAEPKSGPDKNRASLLLSESLQAVLTDKARIEEGLGFRCLGFRLLAVLGARVVQVRVPEPYGLLMMILALNFK